MSIKLNIDIFYKTWKISTIGLFCALAISFSYRDGVSQAPRVHGRDSEIHGNGRKAVPNVVHSPPGSEERAGQRCTNDRWLQALKGKRPGIIHLKFKLALSDCFIFGSLF